MANPAFGIDHPAIDGIDVPLVQLLGLTHELTAALVEENTLLATGAAIPPGATARKAGLAMRLEAASRDVHENGYELEGAPTRLRQDLDAASARLGAVMQENVVRIQAAMGAASSRVEAMMNAVRGKSEADTGYGANGRRQTIVRQPASGRLA